CRSCDPSFAARPIGSRSCSPATARVPSTRPSYRPSTWTVSRTCCRRRSGMTWQVGKLPYAPLGDAGGVVRAKGLVNTREHLESLFEAMERGVASIQDYIESPEERREAAQR